jgi:hypothetical protein
VVRFLGYSNFESPVEFPSKPATSITTAIRKLKRREKHGDALPSGLKLLRAESVEAFMEAFDHEILSTEALAEAKNIHQALLLDSSALGLLMMDGNQTAVDLLRIIAGNAEAEFGDGMVQIGSLVQFLWATAKGLYSTVPAFEKRECDTKTLLTISQLKSQFNTNEMELLIDQTQEEEQAEDGKPAGVGNREETAEEGLAEEVNDPSVFHQKMTENPKYRENLLRWRRRKKRI